MYICIPVNGLSEVIENLDRSYFSGWVDRHKIPGGIRKDVQEIILMGRDSCYKVDQNRVGGGTYWAIRIVDRNIIPVEGGNEIRV